MWVETGDPRTSHHVPRADNYDRFIHLILSVLENSGCNTNIANDVVNLAKSLPNMDCEFFTSQRLMTGLDDIDYFTQSFSVLVDSMRDSLLEMELKTEVELNEISAGFENFKADKSMFYYLTRMTQVKGFRR